MNEITPGSICAVTGLTQTRQVRGLVLKQPMNHRFWNGSVLSDCITTRLWPRQMLPKLASWKKRSRSSYCMGWTRTGDSGSDYGEIQIEILKTLILERFGVDVSFDTGRIVYKETIENLVEGVGHLTSETLCRGTSFAWTWGTRQRYGVLFSLQWGFAGQKLPETCTDSSGGKKS